jgi:hypothetical protein
MMRELFFRGSNGWRGTFAMCEVVKTTRAALHDIGLGWISHGVE